MLELELVIIGAPLLRRVGSLVVAVRVRENGPGGVALDGTVEVSCFPFEDRGELRGPR